MPPITAKQYRQAIAFVIETKLKQLRKTKKQLSYEMFRTGTNGRLWRRMYGRVPWTVVELDGLARWFGTTLPDFLSEAQYWALATLDKESNRMVS